MILDEKKAKEDIIEIGRRLYARGLIVAGEGNLSIRLNEREILATTRGVCKGYLTPAHIIKTDLKGRKITGDSNLEPSTELKMHLTVYQERPDVFAVVHAHPPTATGFAVAGIPLDKCILPEIIVTIGAIPIADYATPSTEEIPDKIRNIIRGRDALLLANHGALAVGKDIYSAYYYMESIEQFAKILLTARILGGERVLDTQQIQRLIAAHPGMSKSAQSCVVNPNSYNEIESPSEYVASCAREEGQMAQAELVMKITKEIINRLQSQSS
jgi:L-fuculose-phosphate aldolase